jgi:hypothetical protein
MVSLKSHQKNLDNSRITIETYQKPMNLYLYIPPLSAHPPSCFKGLIFGEIRRYWLQNTPEKFQATVKTYPKASQQRAQSAYTDPNSNKGGFYFRFPPPGS